MAEKLKIPKTGFLVSYKPTNVKRTSTVSNISSPMNNYYNYLRQTPSSSDNQNTPDDQTDRPFQWSYRTTPGLTGYGMPGNIKFNGQTRSINDVLSTLQNNIDVLNYRQTGNGKHTCTRAIVHALTGQTNYSIPSGVENPETLYNMLAQQGWTDVLDNNYTPMPGDVYTVWGVGGQYGMHSSMYNGYNWGSYTNESSTPYYWDKRSQPGVKMHVMRYVTSSKKGGTINGIRGLIGVV